MEPNDTDRNKLENLAAYRRCADRIRKAWPGFLARRAEWLTPHPLLGNTPEKITENILADLFTEVLDWERSGFNPQVEFADIVLSDVGIRRLIVEAKRPNSLAWNRLAVDRALDQAKGYADRQHVHHVAVSDGIMLYAADLAHGGTRDRVFVPLAAEEPPTDLWWLSVQGIYRPREVPQGAALQMLPSRPVVPATAVDSVLANDEALLHPKYNLPARCFAYVGNHADTRTWKLPYLMEDGSIDAKRLPKAVQSILTNYRGARVRGIPEQSIPDVITRLARAAARAGHLPPHLSNSAQVYHRLAEVLEQLQITIKSD